MCGTGAWQYAATLKPAEVCCRCHVSHFSTISCNPCASTLDCTHADPCTNKAKGVYHAHLEPLQRLYLLLGPPTLLQLGFCRLPLLRLLFYWLVRCALALSMRLLLLASPRLLTRPLLLLFAVNCVWTIWRVCWASRPGGGSRWRHCRMCSSNHILQRWLMWFTLLMDAVTPARAWPLPPTSPAVSVGIQVFCPAASC